MTNTREDSLPNTSCVFVSSIYNKKKHIYLKSRDIYPRIGYIRTSRYCSFLLLCINLTVRTVFLFTIPIQTLLFFAFTFETLYNSTATVQVLGRTFGKKTYTILYRVIKHNVHRIPIPTYLYKSTRVVNMENIKWEILCISVHIRLSGYKHRFRWGKKNHPKHL